ncbi:uncharacterized protein LOC142317455 [Lycorma delicatula]|uniref:uncharacterized protein LOC142317455 n=1 Tax=Lycorma delicatula TaxID=130591 RepID=UPI003F510037
MCRRISASLGPHPQQPAIQLQKPSLARKLVGSAKINLNEYWSVFEAMMDPNSSNLENENMDNERRLAELKLESNESPSITTNTELSRKT